MLRNQAAMGSQELPRNSPRILADSRPCFSLSAIVSLAVDNSTDRAIIEILRMEDNFGPCG